MRTLSFAACIAWLILSLTLGFSHARPSTHDLARGFRPSSAELPVLHSIARSTSRSRELGIADIPACGIRCMVQCLPQSGCSLTDTICMCTSAVLNQHIRDCMVSNCTVADSLGTARVNAELCLLSDESQRSNLIEHTIALFVITIGLVALRIAGKIVSTGVAWNDAPILTATLLAALSVACILAMAKIGFGEHLWNLEDGTFLPILRYFYVSWAIYVAILGLIKLSLIMFYLDVFPFRRFKIAGWIVFWYIVINTLIIFLLTVFACTPVSAFWNRDIKGKCIDIQKLSYANSISAIIQDIVLMVLPMCYLRKMQMKMSRKLAVAVMFMIGSFGCITTILRLRGVVTFKESVDPTWDYVPVVIWSEFEITAGIACVSLPAIRLLLVKIAPTKLKGWLSEVTHGSSHHTPRDRPQKKYSCTRNWHKDDIWINLAPTEVADERQTKGRLGLLPSAETSTSRLKTIESQSTCALSEEQSPMKSDTVTITDELALRAPVPAKSKFGRK